MSRRWAVLVALAAAGLDVGALVVFRRVHEARLVVASLLTAPPSYELRRDAYVAFETEARALEALGIALLVAALIAAIVTFVRARRRAGGGLSAIAAGASAATAGAVGLGVLPGAREFFSGKLWCCLDPTLVHRVRYEFVASQAAPFEVARLAVLAVAVVASGAVLLQARRLREMRPPPSRWGAPPYPRLFAPAVIFAIGLCAFGLTRAERHDARNPPPVREGHMSMREPEQVELPPALGCDLYAPDAPTLALSRGVWLLDGVLARDPAEAAELLAAKRRLWEQVLPNKPFPGRLEVAIPAATPLEAVKPVLAAARAAGYPEMQVLEAVPVPPWPSRTLGEISYRLRGCTVRVAPGQDLPDARTWGEMARALAGR